MDNISSASICPACGVVNRCAITRGEPASSCWCQQHDVVLPLPTVRPASCYCSACLQKIAHQNSAATGGDS